jgi:hypothetical protein
VIVPAQAVGVAIDVYEVLWVTRVQEHTPSDKISRVTSWDAAGAFALGPVGLILVGQLSAALGTQRTLSGHDVYFGAVWPVTVRSLTTVPCLTRNRIADQLSPSWRRKDLPGERH